MYTRQQQKIEHNTFKWKPYTCIIEYFVALSRAKVRAKEREKIDLVAVG